MTFMMTLISLVCAYLLGSLPVGLFVVKIIRGRDIRHWFSGRTGGTNVMRMAGVWAGLVTMAGDLLKALGAVLLADFLTGGNAWAKVGAGLLSILGHNYSIFLLERKDGRIVLRGGAGGVCTLGASGGLWIPALLITIPASLGVLFGIGYASVATISIAFMAFVIFLIRAILGVGPWAYVLFGVAAEAILMWALRPNIRRLIKGEERIVGWRARRAKRRETRVSKGNAIERE
jgi:glycerol-3-phosphate acyltransferase PlsY